MKAVLAAALIAGIALLGSEHARAAAITQIFSLPDIPGLGPGLTVNESGSPISQFNPAFGTLTSVSVTTTAIIIFIGGINTENIANGALFLASSFYPNMSQCFGSCSTTMSLNYNVPPNGDLSGFVGAGTIAPDITMSNNSSGPNLLASTFVGESVTYNYTPAATVPEPGSLSVLAVGLLGLGWAYRRRAHGVRR